MIITLLGSAGVGFVWGWLIAHILTSTRKSILNVVVLGLATALILSEAIWLAGWRSAAFVLVAAGLAFLVHVVWRRKLLNHLAINN